MENRREWEWIEYSFAVMALVMMMMTVSVHAAHDHNTWHLPAKNASASYSHETVAVDLTLVESAVAKGAVCLDGSPPGYHFHRGFGSGVNNWLIHIEGGGWCNNLTVCSLRKHTRLGSSNYMAQKVAFSGILSPNQKQNPDFYNWNRIKVRYCDGASFTGDVEAVHPIYKLYFRGQRIWRAIIDDLLAKGMYKVEQALLSGCSAGGLTSILHCDNFRELLPKSAKVKCLADAGFFINVKDVSGADHIKSFYNDVVTLQQSVKNLPLACTSKIVPSQCFFPQYLLPYIQTPLFILNAAYDSWQIKNIVAPGVADPHGHWHYCKLNIKSCTPNQLQIMQGFRLEMLSALKVFENSITGGMFINGCYAHCQSEMQETWLEADSPRLNKKAIAQAVGDWYFDRGSMKAIDCPYPCDPTCHNRIFTPDELLEN